MREVTWTDEDGKRHISFIRDGDHSSEAPRGIPVIFPDIEEIDWDAVKRDLHNLIVSRQLMTKKDISQKPGQLENAVMIAIKNRLMELYVVPRPEEK